MLTGIHKPTSGQVSVLGKDPVHFSKSDQEKIGYLIQNFVLYPELTVWENLNFAASFYGVTSFQTKTLEQAARICRTERGQAETGECALGRDEETSQPGCHAGA